MKLTEILNLVEESDPVVKNMNLSLNKKTNTSHELLERPKLVINRFVASAQNTNHNKQRDTIRTAPPFVNQVNLKPKEKVVKIDDNIVKPKVKDSLRERKIKDWAFKKISLKELIKTDDLDNNKLPLKSKLQSDFWFDEDELVNNGKQIDLSEYDDPDAEAEFYRQHRNSGMYKNRADAEKNILYKFLDTKLMELSRDRFKLMSYIDYQKKIFVKKQLLKSKSLPGLKCPALEKNKAEDELEDYRKKSVYTESKRKKSSFMAQNQNSTHRSSIISKSSSTTTTTTTNKNIKFSIIHDRLDEEIDEEDENDENQENDPYSFSINSIRKYNLLNSSLRKESLYRNSYNKNNGLNFKQIKKRNLINLNENPVVDYRFKNLINIIKPSYINKEMKDVNRIIEQNEALKTTNLNAEMIEKLKKVKQSAGKLADRAKVAIASGEYIQ